MKILELKDLNEKTTYNKHTAYSLHAATFPKDYKTNFNFEDYSSDFKKPDESKFLFCSLNLKGFPRYDVAPEFLKSYAKEKSFDLFSFQEIRDINFLKEFVDWYNKNQNYREYKLFFNDLRPGNLNLAFVLDIKRFFFYDSVRLFDYIDINKNKGLRSPIVLNLILNNYDIYIVNSHAPARVGSVYNVKRLTFLEVLEYRLLFTYFYYNAILTGDWNWHQKYFPLDKYLDGFEYFKSDYDLKNDFSLYNASPLSNYNFKKYTQKCDTDLYYCNLRYVDYLKYVSDHFPLYCEIEF